MRSAIVVLMIGVLVVGAIVGVIIVASMGAVISDFLR